MPGDGTRVQHLGAAGHLQRLTLKMAAESPCSGVSALMPLFALAVLPPGEASFSITSTWQVRVVGEVGWGTATRRGKGVLKDTSGWPL